MVQVGDNERDQRPIGDLQAFLGEEDAIHAVARCEDLQDLPFHLFVDLPGIDRRAAVGEALVEVFLDAELVAGLLDANL
ncbi:MAG TPA: hypothetical protein PLW86_10205 [Rhodocyclaceae bacterium]|nr:hypothetical protein [Rhodocyclaceae bacterium]